LRDDEPITARIRGRKRRITPQLVRTPAEVERLLYFMRDRSPRLTSFVPFMTADGHIEAEGLERAVKNGFCIVRWQLDGDLP
jgi:hypothetical protein